MRVSRPRRTLPGYAGAGAIARASGLTACFVCMAIIWTPAELHGQSELRGHVLAQRDRRMLVNAEVELPNLGIVTRTDSAGGFSSRASSIWGAPARRPRPRLPP